MFHVSLVEASESVAPSTLIDSPMAPSRVIAAMRVVFLPRLRGTLA